MDTAVKTFETSVETIRGMTDEVQVEAADLLADLARKRYEEDQARKLAYLEAAIAQGEADVAAGRVRPLSDIQKMIKDFESDNGIQR